MSHYPFAWGGGILLRVCKHYRLFHQPVLFLWSIMSKPVFFNSKVVYHDNSREYHIDARGKDISDVLRALETDDVTPVQEEPAQPKSKLPFLVVEKLMELKLYSLQEFEDKYRKAVKGGVKTLAAFLKTYRDLQVLDFQGNDKKQIHAILQAFFPDDITYGYPNFAAYYW